MKKQRLLSLLLAIATVIAMIPSLVVVVAAERTETEVELTEKNSNGFYDIPANAASVKINGKIYTVVDSVEKMNSIAVKDTAIQTITQNIILACDLNYSGNAFWKLSVKDAIFDGNGFGMYNYSIVKDESTDFDPASFGATGTVVIRNLTIGQQGNPIQITCSYSSGSTPVGAVVGYTGATNLTLENIDVYANITVDANNNAKYVGAFVAGHNQTNAILSMNDCHYDGDIVVKNKKVNFFGGAVGYATGSECTLTNVTVKSSITNSNSMSGDWGGLIGYPATSNLTLENCALYGSFNANQNVVFGGLIGRHKTTGTTVISNCENHADITFTIATDITGGLVGILDSTTANVTVENCVNYGDVSVVNTKGVVGGLIGCARNMGSFTVKNSLNAGAISGYTAAGIVGRLGQSTNLPSAATAQDCVNIGGLTSAQGHAGIVFENNVASKTTVTNCVTNVYDTDGNVTYADGAGAALTIQAAIKEIRAKFPTIVFAANDDGTAIVVVDSDVVDTDAVAEAKFLQYKKTNNDTKMDIRVIGLLDKADLTGYANAGFVLTFKQNGEVKNTQTVYTNTVYTSITATDGHEMTVYTKTDLNAEYLYAVELYNIPTEGTFTIEVQAFVTGNGTTADSYDNLVVITVVDGVIQ